MNLEVSSKTYFIQMNKLLIKIGLHVNEGIEKVLEIMESQRLIELCRRSQMISTNLVSRARLFKMVMRVTTILKN